MEWPDFILQHEGDDLTRLVLARDKYPGVDVALAAATIECRRRLREKVPEWYARPELVFPIRLSAEQCSSSATARYKARLAASLLPLLPHSDLPPQSALTASGGSRPSPSCNGRLADLTGGLGVDSWAFSEVFSEVLYNEMLPELADAARRNFYALGAGNIRVCSHRIGGGYNTATPDPESIPVAALLGDFRPDVIYLDPARRGSGGRKVFLLEDCSPDVTRLLPELLAAAPYVLLKLSPMADVSMLLSRLQHVREVHVVAVGGECKELLLLLDRRFDCEPEIVAVEIPERIRNDEGTVRNGKVLPNDVVAVRSDAAAAGKDKVLPNDVVAVRSDAAAVGKDKVLPHHVVAIRFRRGEEADAVPQFGVPEVGNWLFESGKSLSKAGCFNLISERFGLRKLGRNTHLYLAETCPSVHANAGTGCCEDAERVPLPGKWFRVLELLPLDKRGIVAAGSKYPGADVTARGVPLTSDDLAARLKKASKKTAGKIPEQDVADARNDFAGVPKDMPCAWNDLPVHLWGVHCDVSGQNLLLVTVPFSI